ncbi:hypothetical protein C0583_00705 [Candidatus Parcubacteria bacterium]|nr:MAG: hypothetical protein C0583_00705 [Candidatus Parcubacteria bacterium]
MIKEKSIKIKGKEITYKLRKKRGLRRITLSVHSDASVSISTPFFVSQKRAEGFLLEKSEWLISKISFYNEIRKRRNIFTGFGDYKDKKEDVRKIVEKKLEYYNSIYNFKYNKICIRNQRSRWGSC